MHGYGNTCCKHMSTKNMFDRLLPRKRIGTTGRHRVNQSNTIKIHLYDTMRYGIVYLTCSKKLTCSQLSPPRGTNRKIKEKRTKHKVEKHDKSRPVRRSWRRFTIITVTRLAVIYLRISSPLASSTTSVAAGFGRYGMPPPAANDTCTALGQDGSDLSRDLATLTFDLGGLAPVADVGRRPLSMYQVWGS